MKKLFVLILVAMAAAFGMPVYGFSQAHFYQGKTINVVYGGGPGGTVHIPGRPTFVIEYMPGGGSRKAGNYIYRARPDGLTMGVMLSSFVPAAVLGLSGVLYDIDKLHYLGSPTSGEPYIFVTRKETRLDSIEKLRSITGFAQGDEVNLAMMQGELDARWTIQATLVRQAPEWIEKRLVDFHLVHEIPRGRRHPHPVFAQLPDIERFTKSEKERKLLAMQRAFVSAGTPFLLPPGTPLDKVKILRDAMRKTFADPEFHAEFRKMVGEEPEPLPAEELEKAIRELPRDRETVDLFNKLSGADPLPLP